MADYFLGGAVKFLVDLGLYDVVLPFVFIFTIVFATLKKTKILGKYENANTIVAFCFAFAVTASIQYVQGILRFFSVTGLLMVGGVSLLIILGLFGIKGLPTGGEKWYQKLPNIIIIVGVGLVFAYLAIVALGADEFIFGLIPVIPKVVGEVLVAAIAFVLMIKFIIGTQKDSGNSSKKSDKKTSASSSGSGDAPTLVSEQKNEGKDFKL